MKYIIKNVMFPIKEGFDPRKMTERELAGMTEKATSTRSGTLLSARLYRCSVDARKKSDICFCCSVIAETALGEHDVNRAFKRFSPERYEYKPYVVKKALRQPSARPIVVGFGPAGMFAALILARAGMDPIVLERGDDADKRSAAVNVLNRDGILDTESNIQFGEGGAGTFSDGKLNTGIKDPRCRTVLEILSEFGAGSDILIDSKPHVGTDRLITTIKNIRREIIGCGGEVRFRTRFVSFGEKHGSIVSVVTEGADGAEELLCSDMVLATGHSARDTFETLYAAGLTMTPKPFSVGARIEHPQSLIDRAQYGGFSENPLLGAADYKLFCHLPNGRGVYTFCMCPGGYVVNASSESGGVVTNGMSFSDRNGTNANSAVLVGVGPGDYGTGVLDGMYFQRRIERKAYEIAGGYRCITQTVGDFLSRKSGTSPTSVKPTVRPEPFLGNLRAVLPDFAADALSDGIRVFEGRLKGFSSPDALLTGPETRSSSPLRIIRNDGLQSSVKGIYPCGEGAGYAGGIISAAVDGIKAAEAIINKYM